MSVLRYLLVIAAVTTIAVRASVAAPAPIGAWFFDEGSGDTVMEAVGAANGVFNGEVAFGEGVRGTGLAFGPGLGYVVFNADNDPAGQFILHQPGDVTITLWAMIHEGAGHGSWFWTRGEAVDNGRFNIHNGGANQFNFDYREDADKSPDPPHGGVTPVMMEQGVWYHLAVVRSGNDYSIYGDGVAGPVWTDENPVLPTANAWILGGPRGCCPLDASIDEIGVFNAALSEEDVNAVMGGLETVVTAVEPEGKLASTWGEMKSQ